MPGWIIVVRGRNRGGAAFVFQDAVDDVEQMIAQSVANPTQADHLYIATPEILLMHTMMFETLYMAAFQVFLSCLVPKGIDIVG